MLTNKLREIQVTDSDGKVVGLLDEADISRFYLRAADEQQRQDQPPPATEPRTPTRPLARRGRSSRPRQSRPFPSSCGTRRSSLPAPASAPRRSLANSIVNSPLPCVRRAQVGRVAEHLVQRHLGVDGDVAFVAVSVSRITPRRWLIWPTTEPWNSSGACDLDLHDRLEDDRLGLRVGLAEAHERGGLERHVRTSRPRGTRRR